MISIGHERQALTRATCIAVLMHSRLSTSTPIHSYSNGCTSLVTSIRFLTFSILCVIAFLEANCPRKGTSMFGSCRHLQERFEFHLVILWKAIIIISVCRTAQMTKKKKFRRHESSAEPECIDGRNTYFSLTIN